MKLAIYSLKKILFQGEAESVNCQTQSGEVTILNNHTPLVSVLKKGIIKVVDKNKEIKYIPAKDGFLEVRSNSEARLIIQEDTQ